MKPIDPQMLNHECNRLAAVKFVAYGPHIEVIHSVWNHIARITNPIKHPVRRIVDEAFR